MSDFKELIPELDKITANFPLRRSALLPILHRVQKERGYLSESVMEEIAVYLDIPRVDVFEVATFYAWFFTRPVGKHLLLICNNISCYLLDSENLIEILEEELGIREGHTTEDGMFTLLATSCLGACGRGPALMTGDSVFYHLTKEKLLKIVADLRAGKELKGEFPKTI